MDRLCLFKMSNEYITGYSLEKENLKEAICKLLTEGGP